MLSFVVIQISMINDNKNEKLKDLNQGRGMMKAKNSKFMSF